MTPEQHAAEALRLSEVADGLDGLKFDTPEYAIVTALGSLTHAVLALRPDPQAIEVRGEPAPALFLDSDGDVWAELPDGEHVVMLDRETGLWEGVRERSEADRQMWGPLRAIGPFPRTASAS